uniref:ATP synthase lipid-binding protein n=1 Tax=Podarcis muralis TaxID=64176 RepID=A0A670KGT9_PODMU
MTPTSPPLHLWFRTSIHLYRPISSTVLSRPEARTEEGSTTFLTGADSQLTLREFQASAFSRDIDMAAKFIGADTVGVVGSSAGVGTVFRTVLIIGYVRNAFLKQQLFSYAIVGFALSETMGLFWMMMVAFLILFGI